MTERKKLYIKTYGCQMNVYDSQRIADVMKPLGYDPTEEPDDADMLVLNTCHIREKATEKVFSDLGRFKPIKDQGKKAGKKVIIGVAGCVAQAEGDVITQRAPYVDMVFGPQTYHRLAEMVLDIQGDLKRRIVNTDFPVEPKFDHLPTDQAVNGPSAYLAVQEGCDKFCTFCVVPYTRGAEYSRTVVQIIEEAKRLSDKGAKELILLGQNVNAFHGEGPDGKVWSLARLMEALSEISAVERLRYMTSHPRDMEEDLIRAHGDLPKLMPYLHLPVQHGSDRMLKAMNRKHTAQEYIDIIANVRKVRPDIALSSDFIVGFPGETDQDHADNMAFVKEVTYAQAYSFKYSPRPGTPAAAMAPQIREDVKAARLSELQGELFKQATSFNSDFISKTMPILFDRVGKEDSQLHGRSPYNQPVHVTGNKRLLGQTIEVKITGASGSSLTGDIVTVDGNITEAA